MSEAAILHGLEVKSADSLWVDRFTIWLALKGNHSGVQRKPYSLLSCNLQKCIWLNHAKKLFAVQSCPGFKVYTKSLNHSADSSRFARWICPLSQSIPGQMTVWASSWGWQQWIWSLPGVILGPWHINWLNQSLLLHRLRGWSSTSAALALHQDFDTNKLCFFWGSEGWKLDNKTYFCVFVKLQPAFLWLLNPPPSCCIPSSSVPNVRALPRLPKSKICARAWQPMTCLPSGSDVSSRAVASLRLKRIDWAVYIKLSFILVVPDHLTLLFLRRSECSGYTVPIHLPPCPLSNVFKQRLMYTGKTHVEIAYK